MVPTGKVCQILLATSYHASQPAWHISLATSSTRVLRFLCCIMTFQDKPTFENVILENITQNVLSSNIFERGLGFKCYSII